jgi:hypothetical protein
VRYWTPFMSGSSKIRRKSCRNRRLAKRSAIRWASGNIWSATSMTVASLRIITEFMPHAA